MELSLLYTSSTQAKIKIQVLPASHLLRRFDLHFTCALAASSISLSSVGLSGFTISELTRHLNLFLRIAFYGTDVSLIMKALSVLERTGKVRTPNLLLSIKCLSQIAVLIHFFSHQCHVLKGDTSENDGVKFLAV